MRSLLQHFVTITFLAVASSTQAGVISADTISLSTVVGQGNGITFSSSVYIASGNSLTLQGFGGYITSASSMNASAFFGDASHLGIALLSGNNSFSGSNTFMSSFTIQSGGAPIGFSTSSTTNNIAVSSIGAVSFFPELHNSSSTILPEVTFSFSQFGTCINGSTLTVITSGGQIELSFTGSMIVNSTNTIAVNILQDGHFVNNFSSSTGISISEAVAAGNYMPVRLKYLMAAPSPDSHSYCLAMIGDATVCDSKCSNLLYLTELK